MKTIILKFFTFISIIFICDRIFVGFDFLEEGVGFNVIFIFALLLAILDYSSKIVIKFLTFPVNYITHAVYTFFVTVLLFFLGSRIFNGYNLSDGYIKSVSTDWIDLPEIRLSSVGVILMVALIVALLDNIINWALEEI